MDNKSPLNFVVIRILSPDPDTPSQGFVLSERSHHHHHHVACPELDVAVPTSLLHACRFSALVLKKNAAFIKPTHSSHETFRKI